MARITMLLAIVLSTALLCGCKPKSTGDSNATDSTSSGDGISSVEANLAKLSAEDQTLAEKQKICPVSKELLGSMDVPLKVHVADRDVFICCKECEGKLMENPEEYLANIPQ